VSDRPRDPGCAATWATTTRHHLAGDPCGKPAWESIGDVDLCVYHFGRAVGWFHKRYVEAPLRWQEQREEIERQGRTAVSVVYYLHSQISGLVKIGYSSRYRARLSKLQAEHGPLRLLLATPGARAQEEEAHDAFASCRVRGEWFRPEKELLLYIQRARKAQGSGNARLPEAAPIEEVRAMIRALGKAAA